MIEFPQMPLFLAMLLGGAVHGRLIVLKYFAYISPYSVIIDIASCFPLSLVVIFQGFQVKSYA
jgi:hypothetical protein